MALHGLIALLDDIAAIADDVAKMTSLAAKKTAGIVTDDMAVTAENMVGIRRDRELPIIRAVAIGSLRNKLLILVPAALVLNHFAPWLILPLLMVGALFLCFEGAEKILHPDHGHSQHKPVTDNHDFEKLEKDRVKGAIKTDFILSAEIIAVSLATIKASSFMVLVFSLVAISIVMTVGVYGIVALLVRMDDFGLRLARSRSSRLQQWGRGLLWLDPRLIRFIAAVGTAAMLMVGGGIFIHGIPVLEHFIHDVQVMGAAWAPGHIHGAVEWVLGIVMTMSLGLGLGAGVMVVLSILAKARKKISKK